MKRSTASIPKRGWRGYGGPEEDQESSSSADSSEYGSPAAKSPREVSATFDQSQANFEFSGLDQTFAGLNQTSTHDLTEGVGLDMPKRGAKGTTPQKHTPLKHTPQKPMPVVPITTASTAVSEAMSQANVPSSTTASRVCLFVLFVCEASDGQT
jgi:hypothetical protein